MTTIQHKIFAKLKSRIKKAPFISAVAAIIWRNIHPHQNFQGSSNYWNSRYANGGTSGSGSFNHLAQFKADTINGFTRHNNVLSVIEFGCGDGNQLQLASYNSYIGLDVSEHVINICREKFKADESKTFNLIRDYNNNTAELALSLDVIYHLVEDNIFDDYMHQLFKSSRRFIIIYSSNNTALNKMGFGSHVKHRNFTAWVSKNAPEWALVDVLKNRYPYSSSDPDQTSLADFYFYQLPVPGLSPK